jgi:hypothetical protein
MKNKKEKLKILYDLIIRLIIWIILIIFWVWLLITPIINWIPILSHIVVWFYIFLWVSLTIMLWDEFLKEMQK